MLIELNRNLWEDRIKEGQCGEGMKKYCLGDRRDIITINFYTEAKSFGAGGKFALPNLEEKSKDVIKGNDKIIVIGAGHTRASITAPSRLLEDIQKVLKSNSRIPLNQIENLEISE